MSEEENVDEIVASIERADDEEALRIESEHVKQTDNSLHGDNEGNQPPQSPVPLTRDEIELAKEQK